MSISLRSGIVVYAFFDWIALLYASLPVLSFVCVEYKVHAYNRNGLCALGFMDDHYPVRSAFSLLNQVDRISSV